MTVVKRPASIPLQFREWVDLRADEPALFYVSGRQTRGLTWGDLGASVDAWILAMHRLGVRAGDRVVQWSGNRVEWICCDLALQQLRAIHVPLHNTISGQQAADQLRHCGASVLVLGGPEQFQKLSAYIHHLTDVVLTSHDVVAARGPIAVRHFPTWIKESSRVEDDEPLLRELVECYQQELDIDEPTTIIYSSGTMGVSKGVTLSQRNIVSNTKSVVGAFGEQPMDTRLAFLPMSHIFARTCDVYTWLERGSRLALAQSHDTIVEDCKRFQPTLINGVPYFFQRVHQKIVESCKADQPGILKKVLGGEIRGCCSGGAALGNETFDFFESHGIPLLQGYGLTETSPVISLSTLETRKRGTVGQPIEDVEVRIADDGEIMTRGPNVMIGYWRDDAATRSAIRDGWLYTGDLGSLDDDGSLRVTGRKQEMIVTMTGKNVFPAYLEALLCRDPLILQAMVIGNDRKYLTALIVPDPDVLRTEIKARRLWVFRRKSAVRHPTILEIYRQRIEEQLADQSRHEQVRGFKLLDRGFRPENGHLTPKLSLRRDLIEQDFARDIDELYRN